MESTDIHGEYLFSENSFNASDPINSVSLSALRVSVVKKKYPI